MNFLRSKAEQLAEHLRWMIERRELAEPLPSSRDWSRRLAEGHRTLEMALRILAREGLVSVVPRRGVRLAETVTSPAAAAGERVVRWVCRGEQDPSVWAELYVALSERLGEHGIHVVLERCSTARLRGLRDAGERPAQMLLLATLGERYQRWFAGFRRSALLVDLPQAGVRLPWVWNDAESAIAHAVNYLGNRGFQTVGLVMPDDPRRSPVAEPFRQACARARPPVRPEWVRLPHALDEQWPAAKRFARGVRGRLGLVLIYPSPPSVLMTALARRGVDVPGQVELTVVNAMAESVRVLPPQVYYPYPVEALARQIARAAAHYFQTGQLPPLAKRIPLEVVFPR